ncbi:hypothetical protein [uncultured Treponema sp.]|uniref:hypothetical protein n=1 Tax=uncultured Treponema sp. TaxID=162155 RepID=UPI00280BC9CE|nr:hypothetical protein [uncultured Treponema sp.]
MDYVVTDAFGETVGAFGSFEQVKVFFREKVDWLVSAALAKLESTGHLAPCNVRCESEAMDRVRHFLTVRRNGRKISTARIFA